MKSATKDLVSTIRKGTHSDDINLFCRSAVDFVERRVGESEDTRAVKTALDIV